MDVKPQLKVYFAGPDVFRKNPQEYFDGVAEICVKYGVIPLFPFDALFIKSDSIYVRNLELLHKCNLVIANINPFRGPSTDPGTALEIGYAKSLGKPIVGYTKYIDTSYKDRITDEVLQSFSEYPYVENFNLYDNLMISHSCDFVYENIEKAIYGVKSYYKWLLD